MAKVRNRYSNPVDYQFTCDVHSSQSRIDSLVNSDDSPPQFEFVLNSIMRSDNSILSEVAFNNTGDSECGTGSDEDCLTSNEFSQEGQHDLNSTSPSETANSPAWSNLFDFWNKVDVKDNSLDETKHTDSPKHEIFNNLIQSNNRLPLNNNTDPEVMLADLLSISVEEPAYNSPKNAFTTNISQKNSEGLKSLATIDFSPSISSSIPGFDSDCNLYNSFNSKLDVTQKVDETITSPNYQTKTNNAETECNHFDNKSLSSNSSMENLSDMLASICFEGESGISSSKSFKHNVDSNGSKVSNFLFEDPSSLYGSSADTGSNLSDMLSAIFFEDTLNETFIPDSNRLSESGVSLTDFLKSEDISNALSDSYKKEKSQQYDFSINEESVQDISLTALAEKYLSSSPSVKVANEFSKLTEDQEISYFKIPEALLQSDIASLEKEDLSMVDLLTTLNVHKKNISNNGHEVLNKESEKPHFIETINTDRNINDISLQDDADDHLLEVDLTACLKLSNKPSHISSILLTDDRFQNLQPESLESSPFHRFSSPSLIDNKNLCTTHLQTRKVNKKQSLFAKSLSCKSKKDLSAVYKVLKLKNDLCAHFFNPSIPEIPATKSPRTDIISLSNHCVVASISRRIFEPVAPCELV